MKIKRDFNVNNFSVPLVFRTPDPDGKYSPFYMPMVGDQHRDIWYNLKFSDLLKFVNGDGRYGCPRQHCNKNYKDASSLQRHIRYVCVTFLILQLTDFFYCSQIRMWWTKKFSLCRLWQGIFARFSFEATPGIERLRQILFVVDTHKKKHTFVHYHKIARRNTVSKQLFIF